jgi:hypothetical protein
MHAQLRKRTKTFRLSGCILTEYRSGTKREAEGVQNECPETEAFWSCLLPEVKRKKDQTGWEFDFSRTEGMIKMFLDEGFTHIALPHIAGYDRRKEAVARFVVYVDEKPVPGTSYKAYEFLAQYLLAWANMLRRHGPYDRVTR